MRARASGERGARGAVAVEFAAATGLLLLPVVLLVASLPVWAEHRHAAILAAREAARIAAAGYPRDLSAEASAWGEAIAVNHGVRAGDVDVTVEGALVRGGRIEARATVRMPAVAVPGVRAGTWSWTAVQRARIDDYRSG